jgi:hypothetical protein
MPEVEQHRPCASAGGLSGKSSVLYRGTLDAEPAPASWTTASNREPGSALVHACSDDQERIGTGGIAPRPHMQGEAPRFPGEGSRWRTRSGDPGSKVVPAEDVDLRTDQELLSLVGRGERKALATLYRRHGPWLVAALSRRCSDPGTVDTAVGETFLALWSDASSYDGESGPAMRLWRLALAQLADRHSEQPPETGVAGPGTVQLSVDLTIKEETPDD